MFCPHEKEKGTANAPANCATAWSLICYLTLHRSLQGVMKALNVNKLAECGVSFKFWCATTSRQQAAHN